MKYLWGVLALVVAFLGFGAIVGGSPEAKERIQAEKAIELCWKEQERRSLTPAQARFIAGTCEMMEDDFRRKYNRNP